MSRPGRKKKSPITLSELPGRRDLTLDERNRVAKLSLALHSDLLGLTRGEYAARPRWSIGDATTERLQHSRASGMRLAREAEVFEDGRETGLQRKRFIGRLELMRQRGAITAVGFSAAQIFQRDTQSAAMRSGPRIAQYEPRHIDATPPADLHAIERALDYVRRVAAAYRVIPVELHPVLDWLAENATNDQDDRIVSRRYWPSLNEKSASERFKSLLELCLAFLVRHYRLDDAHRWAKLDNSRVVERITELLADQEEKICA
jgi:hypothetical protein